MTNDRMVQMVVGGRVGPAIRKDELEKYGRVEKQYLHLRFSVIGRPGVREKVGQDALWVMQHPLNKDSKPILIIPTKDIVHDLKRIRKMNRHRFLRWLRRQEGWPGLDLTQRAL
jgi:hypothetical protein